MRLVQNDEGLIKVTRFGGGTLRARGSGNARKKQEHVQHPGAKNKA